MKEQKYFEEINFKNISVTKNNPIIFVADCWLRSSIFNCHIFRKLVVNIYQSYDSIYLSETYFIAFLEGWIDLTYTKEVHSEF